MNFFLKTRDEINRSTEWLKDNGYVIHPISAKDWELATVTKHIGDGSLLDMGANGSFALHNAIIKGIKGRKVGIDLLPVTGTNKAEGAEYFQGDLMHTSFEDGEFDTIISLSVIEHEVNFTAFAKEVSRLLKSGGELIVSFDYWPERIDTSLTKLYSLSWNILSKDDAVELIKECRKYGLEISSEVDWTVQDKVINFAYCSPVKGVEYTFGILHFIKK